MTNSIIESISAALNAEFGSRYKIYREEKRQGLKEPCFFIQCLNPASRQFFGNRYLRQNHFCIQYFPENELHGNEECYTVADRLLACLEYIDVGGLVKGTEMNYEVAEGILHFFVDYDMFVYKEEESAPAMEEIFFRTGMKG